MKLYKKIILIILISILIAYLIYIFCHNKTLNILVLGDGVSSGQTSYNVDGLSYNDYLKRYFESEKLLGEYNDSYSFKNNKLSNILDYIEKNNYDELNDIHIKQLIHNAHIITIHFGVEELTKLSITDDLDINELSNLIGIYQTVLKNIKHITEAKIYVIGIYENVYLNQSDVIIFNSEVKNICDKLDMIFIDISDLLKNKDYFLNKNSFYFNYSAHEMIAKMLINSF